MIEGLFEISAMFIHRKELWMWYTMAYIGVRQLVNSNYEATSTIVFEYGQVIVPSPLQSGLP